MTPYERYMAVFHREKPDYVPFAIYETKVVGRPYEKELTALDILMIRRKVAYRVWSDESYIEEKSCFTRPNGDVERHFVVHTPKGNLSYANITNAVTSWTTEFPFKDEADYEKLSCIYRSIKYAPAYENLTDGLRENEKKGNVLMRVHLPAEPMQEMFSSVFGAEQFCYEWMDNRDKMLELIDILHEKYKIMYDLTAPVPVELINQGGNVTPEVIGREGFQKYYMPEYEEAAKRMHPRGKLLGCHLDACNGPIMDLIAETPLDYIEAYDPGMSPPVKEASRIFKDKVLSLHFPSAWQMHSEEQIIEDTLRIIGEAADPSRLIIGITEDMPYDRYVPVIRGIMRGIEKFGKLN